MSRSRYRVRCADCAWNGWATNRAFADESVYTHENATGHTAEAIDRGPASRRTVIRLPKLCRTCTFAADGSDGLCYMCRDRSNDGPEALKELFRF